jgi:hypothetical protein
MRETWYVMEDGSVADPKFIVTGEDGTLRHEDGRKVAYAPHGPRSRGVDAEAIDAVDPPAPADAKNMRPARPGRGYQTRESKAD